MLHPRNVLKGVICAMLVSVALLVAATFAAENVPPANRWIPKDAVIAVELTRPKAVLEMLTGEKTTAAITRLPLYKQLTSQPKFQEFVNIIRFMELSLGTDWRTAAAKLTGGGITFAILPEGDGAAVLIVEAQDAEMLEKLHGLLLNQARTEAGNAGQSERVASKEYDGVTAWTFNGGQEAHAIIDSRLVLSNKPEGLRAVLRLRSGGEGESLASNKAYRAARRAAGSKTIARAFVNLKPLMEIPDMAKLLDQERSNPLAALMFSGIVEAVRGSSWLSLGLNIDHQSLSLRISADGVAETTGDAAFALPGADGEGAPGNLRVPRRLAAMSLYRDLHEFYASKDELFPERTSGLIFFENMMGIFFSGRDLTSEVLAQTEPGIRLVVAEQEYDAEVGTPQVKLPGFAVVFKLREPEQFKMVVEEAWQKAVGLINFTRGQQAMPGLIIERPVQGNTTFTTAYFSSVDVEDKAKLDQRFNFRPSVAMPGEYLILSSTDGLARDIIDALESEKASEPIVGTNSAVEFDGVQIASILRENRGTLVLGDMVNKGKTREQSEAGIDLMITLVDLLKQLKLSIGTEEGLTRGLLELKLNLQ